LKLRRYGSKLPALAALDSGAAGGPAVCFFRSGTFFFSCS
jgi:hypothetical protein